MNVIMILFLLIIKIRLIYSSFRLYNTINKQNNHLDSDCIYFHHTWSNSIEKKFSYEYFVHSRSTVLLNYCRRRLSIDEETKLKKESSKEIPSFTFQELHERNITASQLFAWQAPLDLIEQYIIFQSENKNNNMTFFNCSSIRFGNQCEYQSSVKSFTQFVKNRFQVRENFRFVDQLRSFTCYMTECKRFSENDFLCLDHREICDGKVDCLDGSDEKYCWQLEINECTQDEYRCRNGLCIPKSFAFDYEYDCFDSSDERNLQRTQLSSACADYWWNQCDIQRCNTGSLDFSCGDGTCSKVSYTGRAVLRQASISTCKSNRDHLYSKSIYNLSTLCAKYVACMLDVYIDRAECKIHCLKNKCAPSISKVCPKPYFLFPTGPVLLDIVYFRYHNNRTVNFWKKNVPPEDICYDQRACRLPSLIKSNIESTMQTDNGIKLICRPYESFPYLPKVFYDNYTYISSIHWEKLLDAVKDSFRDCIPISLTVDEEKQKLINRHLISCSSNSTKKISPHRFADGFPDCSGALDEKLDIDTCSFDLSHRFLCSSSSSQCITRSMLNDQMIDCTDKNDERLDPQCELDNINAIGCERMRNHELLLANDSVFIRRNLPTDSWINIFPSLTLDLHKPIKLKTSSSLSSQFIVWGCHRGILIDDNDTCLCPPAYYGNRCQYQQSHLSLIIQVIKTTYFNQEYHLFSFVIMLIHVNQSERIINSEQIYYVSYHDCLKKTILTLPYPRNTTIFDRENIYVRIDAFTVGTMISNYWSSWIFRPLSFPFLPVNQLAIQLVLPAKPSHRFSCNSCSHLPNHQCVLSTNNNPPKIVCIINNDQCQSTCSNGSSCVTPNLCVCSQGRLGSQCRVPFDICNPNPCLNNGYCIALDERTIRQYQCLCKENYLGSNCQFNKTKITIKFSQEEQILKSEAVLFHFINILKTNETIRYSIFKKISSANLVLYRTEERMLKLLNEDRYVLPDMLQIVIAQSFGFNENDRKNFYLISKNLHDYDKNFKDSDGKIENSTRCLHLHINKSREEICQNSQCYYDDFQLCLCHISSTKYLKCVPMKNNEIFNCEKQQQICENDGLCIQNYRHCPTESFCLCPFCTYGTYCQFSIQNYSLSLDALLGPYLDRSSLITNLYLILSLLIISFGIIFNSLSTLTFIRSDTRQVGCGIYLFYSSIFSNATLIIFSIKMIYLIKIYSSNVPSYISCLLIEFFLKYFPECATWLNVCVSIERLMNILLTSKFNRKKSQSIAHWLVWIILLMNILISIHDPLHRHVFIEPDEKRGWCVVKYPSRSWLNKYNSILNIIHLVCPFIFHIISSLTIIIKTTQIKQTVGKENEKLIWLHQLREHKHILIGPLFLGLFALPRLIVSFLYVCNDHYYSGTGSTFTLIYLTAFYVSFIPHTTILFIFILPSHLYKTALMNSLKRYSSS